LTRNDDNVLKALLFDVQGAATDFHSTVTDQARRIGAGRHPRIDWAELVRRWRAGYFTALDAAPGRHDQWISVHSACNPPKS
jgi:2-haloacid dehalogenase